MSNHYHFLVETPDANLSRGMRQLNGVYSQMFNRVNNRVGHVFHGCYKAIHVEKEDYLLELCRYVVLIPVGAGMVRSACEWRWSSYRATAGQVEVPTYIKVDWVLGCFGNRNGKAIEEFVIELMNSIDSGKDLSAVITGTGIK